MAFVWGAQWDDAGNHNGTSQDQVIAILARTQYARGDGGLLAALAAASGTVTIEKGIHQDRDLHIRVFYLGGTWHVNLVGTNGGGPADYRVGEVTQ